MPSSPTPARLVNTMPALGYDTSTYELSEQIPAGLEPWTRHDLLAVLEQRSALEKARRELSVYYYRIYHTLAFPLPLDRRPAQMPVGISGRAWYPWLIWLSWMLEERWRTLHAAWRHLDDQEAGRLLQTELAALDGWSTFRNWNDEVGLPTAHIAACLARFLADKAGWDERLHRQAWNAAQRLVEEEVWPWFQQTWAARRDLAPHDIHNIPVIALVRGAQLARAIGSPRADALEERARETLRAWWRLRRDNVAPHSEGASYDGYLMDAFTGWLDGLGEEQETLLTEGRDAFASLVEQWVDSTLPGRLDLHAPLGDVEPEMPFWMTAMLRLCTWYAAEAGFRPGRWLLHRVPPVRLPAAALAWLWEHRSIARIDTAPPTSRPQAVANAVTLRTGWNSEDTLTMVGLSRSQMSHLHNDGGHVIVGWWNRFWITDPGYQQYCPGEERNFTLGISAHNPPVIDGIHQTQQGVRLVGLGADEQGRQHTSLDLTNCYVGLPPAAQVLRDVWLIPVEQGDAPLVIVRDVIGGVNPGAEVRTHWQGGAHLAWAFQDGWARLSDGKRALWIGAVPGEIKAMQLERHPGSRGPLTLVHVSKLPHGQGLRWWVFYGDSTLGWQPPTVEVGPNGLRLHPFHQQRDIIQIQ